MEIYKRRLPHWQPEDAPMFVTWRLFGSLPRGKVIADRELTAGQRFAAVDQVLDRATSGPMWLVDTRIAQVVVETLYRGQDTWKLYDLIAWVLMSNHVHLLIQPKAPLAAITRAVKKRSARIANEILERWGSFPSGRTNPTTTGSASDSAELTRITHYIEWNPVRAGFVPSPELWPWSSARQVWIPAPRACFQNFLSLSAIPISPSGLNSGNKITSRIDGEFVSSITSRSIPRPSPPVGGIPYDIARR